MSRNNITSLHIQKLGHELEEIRVRALNNILSKLDYGTLGEKELLTKRELVFRLLDWLVKFGSNKEKEKILRLLMRILHADVDGKLSAYLDTPRISEALQTIQSSIEPEFNSLLDQIIHSVAVLKSIPGSISRHVEIPAIPIPSTDQMSIDSKSSGSVTSSTREQYGVFDLPLPPRLDSPLFSKRSHRYKQGYFDEKNEIPAVPVEYPSCFPHLLLPWQPLIITDRHVLTAVEDSLKNITEPALLIHSCHFFSDVVLQDFPAEVFLQRPAIVTSFLELLDTTKTGNTQRVCSVVMKCLCKLTAALHIRVHYYNDPCIANLKQETCTTSGSSVSTPSFGSSLPRTRVEGDTGAGDYLKNDNPLLDTEQTTKAFHYLRKPSNEKSQSAGSNSDSDVEDSILLQLRQLNLPQFCLLTMTQLLPHLNLPSVDFTLLSSAINLTVELTNLLILCVSSEVWQCSDVISTEISERIKHALILLGQTLEYQKQRDTSEEVNRVMYLQVLALTRKILKSVVPVSQADIIVPNILKTALITSMFDHSMSILLPSLHSDISSYAKTFSGHSHMDMLRAYNDTTIICESMDAAVRFMKSKDTIEPDDLFVLMNESVVSLSFHMNLEFVSRCVDICITHHRHINKLGYAVVVKLLAHCETEVRLQMYATCHQYVLAILGVDHIKPSRSPQQLAFLYDTNVLIEIICHGTYSSNKKIQQYSEEILIHSLKGKFLMAEPTWRTFLESLVPALPLLQCFSSKTTVLGRAVAKMLDPDISASIYLPENEVLKGNLRLMFSGDPLSRDEAVSRLMWLLSRESQSYDKSPELSSAHCNIFSGLCILERPSHIVKNRYTQAFYEESSLCQVIELLTAEGVEPIVKRSALTQICVMLEHPQLHSTFIAQQGISVLLDIFQKALLVKDYFNLPDSVIPIVTILKNLAYQNPKVRQDLSNQTSLYYCILRAGFMYFKDNRLRHDASQLLFLLLYSDFILIVPESNGQPVTASYGVSIPELAARRMCVPFLSHTHWRTSHNTDVSIRTVLMNDNLCQQLLKLSWNVAWYGGIAELLEWESLPSPSDKFSQFLYLDHDIMSCLKATAISHSCRQQLYNIQNATSHQEVADSVWCLTGCINLHNLVTNGHTDSYANHSLDYCWEDLPWENTLIRFLRTPPACDEDEELLVNILQFLRIYLSARKGKDCYWIIKILKNGNHAVPNLLKVTENGGGDIEANPSKELCQEMLLLAKDCVVMERKWDYASQDDVNKRKSGKYSWVHIIRTIARNLKFGDTQHFYNLSFLDWMLTCLSNLTGSIGWSLGCSNATSLWQELIACLTELVTAFHCGRGGAGGASFMGLSITRSAILCMNHLLVEMLEQTVNKGWEQIWSSALATRGETNLRWLSSLWQSRDSVTRAAALQLAAGFCSSSKGCAHFMDGLHIWSSGISFLMDHEESSLVREQASILLTNLCSHSTPSCGNESGPLSLCLASLTPGNDTTTGTQALISLLEHTNFFGELATLLSRLYVGSTVDLGGYMITVDSDKWTVESLSGRQLAPGADLQPNEYILVYNKNLEGGPLSSSSSTLQTDLSEDRVKEAEREPYVVTTPSLVKSVSWLLVNLLNLIPEEVLKNVNSFGLARSLFRCLNAMPCYQDEREASQLYLDVVELNSGVCSALALCVASSKECRKSVIQTQDSLSTLMTLFDPALYPTHRPHLLFLRNRLWTSIFRLLSSLLTEGNEYGYRIICDTMYNCNFKSFFATIEISINDNSSSDLVHAALATLTSMLCHETNVLNQSDVLDTSVCCSLQNLLDTPKTVDTNGDDQEIVNSEECELSGKFVGGAELCELLLDLYETHRLQQEGQVMVKGKSAVSGALMSLVAVSWQAKRQALSRGLLDVIIVQLRELHIRLSIDSVESLKRIVEKKRVCPVLNELTAHFSLLTNFISGCIEVKMAAAEKGLADLMHKLWVWCNALPSLLDDTLKLLCTFTTDCVPACQSLVLTTTVPGIGLRKTASSVSLLHAIFTLVTKEMETFSRQQSSQTLSLAFQLLKNACRAQECRTVMSKGNLFYSLPKLHPMLTKKQKHWEVVEMLWMSFLADFTYNVEGQLSVPKMPEVLDLLVALTNSASRATKTASLVVLRNIAFNHSNRSRLLASGEFLKLLLTKLGDGSLEEKYMAASIVWALVANNQKAKLIMKCTGIDVKLQEAFNHHCIIIRDTEDYRIKTISYVLGLLRNEDGKTKKW